MQTWAVTTQLCSLWMLESQSANETIQCLPATQDDCGVLSIPERLFCWLRISATHTNYKPRWGGRRSWRGRACPLTWELHRPVGGALPPPGLASFFTEAISRTSLERARWWDQGACEGDWTPLRPLYKLLRFWHKCGNLIFALRRHALEVSVGTYDTCGPPAWSGPALSSVSPAPCVRDPVPHFTRELLRLWTNTGHINNFSTSLLICILVV